MCVCVCECGSECESRTFYIAGEVNALTESEHLGHTVVREIREDVTFDPILNKVHVPKECHEAVSRGNKVYGSIDDS